MNKTLLPIDRFIAFQVAKRLIVAVVNAKISDAELRDQATRAAKGAALNTAESSGRTAFRDRQRVLSIARGECVEAAAAIEIAAALGAVDAEAAREVKEISAELYRILTALCR